MGANFQTRSLNPKVQTASAVHDYFRATRADAAHYSRSENLDAGYTGNWDSCYGTLIVLEITYDTFEAAQAFMQECDGPRAVRVRTIKPSLAMQRADTALREAVNVLWRLPQGSPAHKAAERAVKNARKRLDTLTQTAIKRSKTSHYVIGGWCKE